mgnify:CR=1 FL=1
MEKKDKNILIIEDDDELLEFYISFIEMHFQWNKIYSASSAEDAKHIIKVRELAVVISDYKLPDLNGIELLKKLHDKYIQIPKYIFVTGFNSPKFRKEAMSLGAVTILSKPVGQNLIDALRSI